MSKKNIQIFITHYQPLKERKEYLDKQIKKNNLNVFFITSFDRGSPEFNEINFRFRRILWFKQLFTILDVVFHNSKSKIPHKVKRSAFQMAKLTLKNKIYKLFFPFTCLPRVLNNSEISLIFKHIDALKRIVISQKPGVICEDDIRLENYSDKVLQEAYKLCNSEFDFINLGHASKPLPFFQYDKPLEGNYRFIELSIPRSCTTLAYMVSPKAANILLNGLRELIMPADWQIQYLLLKNNLRAAWVIPPLFSHGSVDIYQSSLDR